LIGNKGQFIIQYSFVHDLNNEPEVDNNNDIFQKTKKLKERVRDKETKVFLQSQYTFRYTGHKNI
jgi:hypothetical protein